MNVIILPYGAPAITIPEPAECDHLDQDATGGPERPAMDAEQSREHDAGEAATVSASALPPPALLAPGDPASVEGASGDVRRHAPPATNPKRNRNRAAAKQNLEVAEAGIDVPGVGLSMAGSSTATSELMDVTAGETAPNSINLPNPFNWTDRAAHNTVVRQHGGTSGAVLDASPPSSKSAPGGASKPLYDRNGPDPLAIPEFLLRKRSAAA